MQGSLGKGSGRNNSGASTRDHGLGLGRAADRRALKGSARRSSRPSRKVAESLARCCGEGVRGRKPPKAKRGRMMRIERRYTRDGESPYADIAFRLTTSEIRNPDGSVVFRADDVEVPAAWSQVASDVLAQKYFRKAGVPARLKKIEEATVPSWLWRSVADDAALKELPERERFVGEHSSKQVFDR